MWYLFTYNHLRFTSLTCYFLKHAIMLKNVFAHHLRAASGVLAWDDCMLTANLRVFFILAKQKFLLTTFLAISAEKLDTIDEVPHLSMWAIELPFSTTVWTFNIQFLWGVLLLNVTDALITEYSLTGFAFTHFKREHVADVALILAQFLFFSHTCLLASCFYHVACDLRAQVNTAAAAAVRSSTYHQLLVV